jgi:hypothetical protein
MVSKNVPLQCFVVPLGTSFNLCLQPEKSRTDDCMQARTDQHGGYKIDNKKLVIANSKSDRHHTSIHHRQVASGPNANDGFASLKVCSPELPCREFPDHLLQLLTPTTNPALEELVVPMPLLTTN